LGMGMIPYTSQVPDSNLKAPASASPRFADRPLGAVVSEGVEA